MMEKEVKTIETETDGFLILYSKFKNEKLLKKELVEINNQLDWYKNAIFIDIEKITTILVEDGFLQSDKKTLTEKGIIGSSISECNELLFTEAVFSGILDDLEFPEIIAILASFINEKENEVQYISELDVPLKIKNVLNSLTKKADYFIEKEDNMKLYLKTDYTLYLDFIESAYKWASFDESNTEIYDGNFVKAIMRINNVCENLLEICKTIGKYQICTNIERYKIRLW